MCEVSHSEWLGLGELQLTPLASGLSALQCSKPRGGLLLALSGKKYRWADRYLDTVVCGVFFNFVAGHRLQPWFFRAAAEAEIDG